MGRIQGFYQSSIGKKFIMAATGIVLFGFVVGHMIGNLKFYQGPEKINAYAVGLRTIGAPLFGEGDLLWLARLVLLGSVFLHILVAVQLARRNRSARPQKYKITRHVQSSYAARTMVWSGPILGLFIIFHILHLTTGAAHPSFDPDNVYRNLVSGFQVWYVSLFYVVAMLSLGYHMIHGVWSLFQSLGVNDTPYDQTIRQIAAVATAAVVIGNISFPVSVLLGIVS